MEKVTQYKQIVFDVFSEIYAMTPNEEGIERQLIADMERGHFVLFSMGWYQEYKREYIPFLHVDVKENGRVYIEHDGTDLIVADWLIERGIPSQDIVLAFHAPFRRAMIKDFALN